MCASAKQSPDQSIAVSVVPMPRRDRILGRAATNLGVGLRYRRAEDLEQGTGGDLRIMGT